MECSWSAHGVHRKVWGSVKYSCIIENGGSQRCQMIYNACIFVGVAIYGHSNHTMDITIEFTSKNSFNICICVSISIYGYSDHTIDITIEFTSKNGSK